MADYERILREVQEESRREDALIDEWLATHPKRYRVTITNISGGAPYEAMRVDVDEYFEWRKGHGSQENG